MSSDSPENAVRPAAERLLLLLKTRGPQSARELAKHLGVSGEAVRQQLARLAADGLVETTPTRSGGVGRPTQVWALTAGGNARFPDAHAELTAELIALIRAEFGEDALDRLIDSRSARLKAGYVEALAGTSQLAERVARLAQERTREGYMAEFHADDSGFVLVENHCPICAAASACQGFCRTELETFRAVLGDDATVERLEHIVQGHRRCTYRISPKDSSPPVPKPRPSRQGRRD